MSEKDPRGYNMHLPGAVEGAEPKRLERAEAWRVRNEKVQAIRAAFAAARDKGPVTVADLYAIRAGILSPSDYGRPILSATPRSKR